MTLRRRAAGIVVERAEAPSPHWPGGPIHGRRAALVVRPGTSKGPRGASRRAVVFRDGVVMLVAGARNHLNLHFLSTCLRVLEQMAAGNHGDLFRTAA